jgi:predicted XRE-type DNA-binding protein
MKIKKVGTRKLTKDEIALDKTVKSKLKNDKFGSIGLPPNASEIEKMKFSIARDIIIFKLKSETSQTDMAKIMGVSKSRVSEILHYRLSKYSLDTLIKYLFTLKGHLKETDKRIEVIADLFKIAA